MFRRSLPIAILLTTCTAAWAQAPVGELYATGGANVRGQVVLAGGGTIVLSGSSVSAGSSPAVLRLARGGEVRICPATALTTTAGKRSELTFGIGTGGLELRYDLDSHSDNVVTPDFRMLLAGPGSFRIAVGTRPNGDTCLKSLEGNAAAVIVNEQLGDGTFQLLPGDAVLFRGGNINQVVREPGLPCGCPGPAAVMMAESPAPKPATAMPAAPAPAPVAASPAPVVATPAASAGAPVPEAPPAAQRSSIMVNVPMAFNADAAAPPEPAPSPAREPVRQLAANLNSPALWVAPPVLPPPEQPKPQKKGFFARFFGALFGHRKSS